MVIHKEQITAIKLPHGFSLWSENTAAKLALAEKLFPEFLETVLTVI